MLEWLTALPWYLWLMIIAIIVIPIIVVFIMLRAGWRWEVEHVFRDGTHETFPATIEHGKTTYYPYRKGVKKGEPMEKTITTEPSPRMKGPVSYHTYLCNDDCPTTLPWPKEVGTIEYKDIADAKCPSCKKEFSITRNLSIPTTEANPESKPVIITTAHGRGIIKALREQAKSVGRGPWLMYILIAVMFTALGASLTFSIIAGTGHYKAILMGGMLLG